VPQGSPATPHETHPRGFVMTPGELESHRRELDRLLEIRDRDLPALLRNARTFVASDAAEEIAQIREDHHVVEARIRQLEELVRKAEGPTTPVG